MGTLIMIGQILAALAILVTIHELGHFLAARLFKIRVDKFYLFFDFLFPVPTLLNFSLFKKKIGDTEYGIGWFPMGGYVQIAGMIDEQMDKNQINTPPAPDEYRAKPAWQRLIVLMGGIIFNIVLGIIVFTGIKACWGDSYLPANIINAKTGIYVAPSVEKLGFKQKDKIVKLNGKAIKKYDELFKTDFLLADKKEVTVLRNGKTVTFNPGDGFANTLAAGKSTPLLMYIDPVRVDSVLPNSNAKEAKFQKNDIFLEINNLMVPAQSLVTYQFSQSKGKLIPVKVLRGTDTVILKTKVSNEGTIGVALQATLIKETDYINDTYSFGQSLSKGTEAAMNGLTSNVKGFGAIFSGKLDASKSLSGPIGMARMFGSTWNWQRFWNLTGLLSMALAFFNLLPIPGLDGGHATFVIFEMITGKQPNEKFQYAMQVVGTVIILTLMVLIFGLDIYNAIAGK